METILEWGMRIAGSLASPAELPLSSQVAAGAMLFVSGACLALVRGLGRREPVEAEPVVEYDEAA